MAHGSGGGATHRLIRELFLRHLGNPILQQLNDAGVIDIEWNGLRGDAAAGAGEPGGLGGARLAITTDSFVVKPLFFRGGDIGRLAVCGTVNDLAVCGARPLYLTLGMIIEEGLSFELLERVVLSIQKTCQEACVQVVTGDTKVVEKGQADGLYINTTGVGFVPPGVRLGGEKARPGDAVIVSGTLGDHGMAVMSERAGIAWETSIESDCAPLNGLIQSVLAVAPEVHCFRDPTRGGLATTLNEIAAQSRVGIRIEESALPISDAVRGACEMLGFDPLYVANEGKVVAIVPAAQADDVLTAMRQHPYGRMAVRIGEVVNEHPGMVTLRTMIGGERILDMPEGEMLPRIC
ncbi:MAG: hydrogenase expression/formation protein HypE [Syntrophothermus sp.]